MSDGNLLFNYNDGKDSGSETPYSITDRIV